LTAPACPFPDGLWRYIVRVKRDHATAAAFTFGTYVAATAAAARETAQRDIDQREGWVQTRMPLKYRPAKPLIIVSVTSTRPGAP